MIFVAAAFPISTGLGLSGVAAEQGAIYLRAIGWTLLPLAFTPLMDGAFIAMGDTRTPMKLHALSLLLNVILTPLLVFASMRGVPGLGLGIAGAAVASNTARCVATVLGMGLLAEDSNDMMEHIDKNGDKKISMDELRDFLRKF